MAIDFTTLNNACVLYYSMDNADVSGSTILDLTPNNNDGTINGATTGAVGILNEAISFDGTNDYADVTTNSFDFSNNQIIYSLWIKWNNGADGRERLIDYNNGPDGLYIINNDVELWVNGNKLEVAAGLSTGTWTHLCAIYDGATQEIFVDGVSQGTQSLTTSVSNPTSMQLGGKIGGGNSYEGDMDEVVILNSLAGGTRQELATYFYNQGAPTPNQQYPFSANTVYEITGQVTLSGTATQGATLRLYDQTGGTYEGSTTTDVSGNYLFDNLTDGNEYHVSVEYDDGTTKYNDESKPYVTPTEQ